MSTLENAFKVLGLCICTFLAITLGYLGFKSLNASGEISYCFIETHEVAHLENYYSLDGFREYRQDTKIAYFKTVQEAMDFAVKMNCKIGVK